MKPGPHELAQQHPTKQDVNNDLVMHQKMPCPREVGGRTINQFGADFRYAVEFSKYGRAPLEVSRPPPGQPDLRYRLGSTTPNRLCRTDPDSPRRRVRRRLRCYGGGSSGCPPGRPAAADLSGPAAVRFPLGHGESYGAVAPLVKPAGQERFE